MPGMNGIEVIQPLRAINPALKTVMASGSVDDALTEAARETGVTKLIFQENDSEAFCAVISRLMGEAG